ncbi:hypothetical protein [Helicobacter sp. 11S02596-1]|uniref:hypothetical protein n=1 Tax=Helicobacter sp. 11S02596-1 TaxID=1476194 RepID=UPI000BA5B9B6|nr:hypothetical protein [Helicobacter sp. 11S02596-1]PAF41043.1 hypothetical protein BJI48_09145 [Helicobacter sp. 11S02596-1]
MGVKKLLGIFLISVLAIQLHTQPTKNNKSKSIKHQTSVLGLTLGKTTIDEMLKTPPFNKCHFAVEEVPLVAIKGFIRHYFNHFIIGGVYYEL